MGNVDQQKMKMEEEAEKLRAAELVKQFKTEMGLVSPAPSGGTVEKTIGGREGQHRPHSSEENPGEMAVKIEKGGWMVIGLIGVGLVGYSLKKYGILDKIAPSAKVQESTVPKRVDLPVLNPSLASNVAAVPAPGSAPGCTDKPEVRMLVWAWNAQMGLMFANGGPQATTGSLMCKEGVNLS